MNTVQLHDKTFKPFISEEAIQLSIKKLGQVIQKDYHGLNPVFIGVLNGSFLFIADLVRHFDGDCEVTFMRMSSYEGTQTTGKVNELLGVKENLSNRHVLLIEDIVDTGNTLEKIYSIIKQQNPASLKIATLLFKPNAYKKSIPVDYVAMEVGNEFLVGYGLDYDGLGRNLKEIYIITD